MEASKPAASVPRLTDLFGSVLLPVPINPLENELFSSWFVRVARANGLRCHHLARILTGRGRQLFIGDIDRGIWEEPIHRLADLVGISHEIAKATLLSSYTPFLWTETKLRGVWPFVLPMSTKDHGSRRHGLQYCPICLATDPVPYFRKHWRLSFTVACEVHGVYLKDRCPSCNAPISIERGDIKNTRFQDIPTIGQCARCKRSLIESAAADLVPPELLARQRLILLTLHRGWININGHVIYSHLYFHGIRMLMSFLDNSRYSEKLYPTLSLQGGIHLKGSFPSGYRYGGIEQSDLHRRIELIKALDWILRDWPKRCTDLKSLRFNSVSVLLFNGNSPSPVPFWLWEPIWDELNKSMYVPSIEEIQNACRHLFKQRKQPPMRELCKLLNLSTLYSYRISAVWKTFINS